MSNKEVLSADKGFPNGSTGGLDGLKPQHPKDLLAPSNGEISTELCETLQKLADQVIQGQVPPNIAAYFYEATLTPLLRKDGEIRPIAVGNVVRRMVAKIITKRVESQAGFMLLFQQFGFGTAGGADEVVHSCRSFLQTKPVTCKLFVKLDFCNAFNTLHRQRVLEES